MLKKRADGYLTKSFSVNGKRYFVYAKTAAELSHKEVEKRVELAKGIENRINPVLDEYFDKWAYNRQGMVSEATIRTQNKIYNIISRIPIVSLARNFGELRIKEVTIDDLRDVQRALKKTRKTQTVNDYMSLLKHIFSDAKKERLIDYNPCDSLNTFRRTEERARDTKHRALSLDEQTAFFTCERAKSSYYYNIFKFAILTGMRVGEIGALRYSDIKDDIIHVERTITRIETGEYIIGDDAKTKAGKRIIPINTAIKEVIAEQKELNTLIDGKIASNRDLLFKAAGRGLLMATPIDRDLKKICNKIGIEPFTMHAFRATFATRCIEGGMNPKTLQEILGHSSFNITMSLYGHCLKETKVNEMDAVKIEL